MLKTKKPQTIRYLAFLYVPLSNKKMTLYVLRSGCLVPSNTADNTERKLRFDKVEWTHSLASSHLGIRKEKSIRNQFKCEASFSMCMTQKCIFRQRTLLQCAHLSRMLRIKRNGCLCGVMVSKARVRAPRTPPPGLHDVKKSSKYLL